VSTIEIRLHEAREQVLITGLGDQAIEMLNALPSLDSLMPQLTVDQAEHDLLTMGESKRRQLLGLSYWQHTSFYKEGEA
jgi:hypothetical protein